MTKLILVGEFLGSGKTTLLKLLESMTEVCHVKLVVEAGREQRTANLGNVRGEVFVSDRTPLRGAKATPIFNAPTVRAAIARLFGAGDAGLDHGIPLLSSGPPSTRLPVSGRPFFSPQ